MKRLPIKLAADICKSYKLKQAVVICRDEQDIDHVITYGKDKKNCKEAGIAGDNLKQFLLKWPKTTLSKYAGADKAEG